MSDIPKVLLLVETSREYGRALLRGIAKYCRLHGPWAFYREPGGLEKALPKLQSWGVTGIITRDSIKTEEAMALGVPVIVAVHFKSSYNIPSVDTNPVKIGKMAAEHLLDRGLRNFAFCGFDNMPWSESRKENFAKSVTDAGCKIHFYKQPLSKSMRTWQKEQRSMAEWLKSLPKPVGLMACNDDRGQHAIEACKIANMKVPDDVAVIGVDNDELICDLTEPPLTSVALDVEKAGYHTAELLDKLMAGKKIEDQKITVEPTHVISRQSTDILAIDDMAVSEAVRFIRKNSNRPIQVGDVVAAVLVSRRSLEQRFLNKIGRSIFREIRRARVERITNMLVETNLSIAQIAIDLGFSGIDHIARYFYSEKGTSPQAYRKSHRSF